MKKPFNSRTRSLLLFLIAACGGSAGPARQPAPPAPSQQAQPQAASRAEHVPSCADVIASIRKVAIEASGASTEEEREYVATYLDGALQDTRKACETTPWSAAQRRCALVAASEREMLMCDRDAAIERGEDLGGPSCEAVADHMTKVTIDPIGPSPEHREELRDRFATYCQPWPRAQKECVLAATTQDAITACGKR